MIERGSNKAKLVPVERRDANTLLPIIAANVAPGSIIVSDGWAAYGRVASLQQQFKYRWVNHKLNFVNPNDSNTHTQSIEGTRSATKRTLRHLHGTSEELFPTYLYQYMFRRMYSHTKIFENMLESIRTVYNFD
uniref:ISXO2-like transposase domain-containing protein n=1 Tax=Ditylenchus dipsaci TaxID=166011 RepID=A0A915CSY0_9BILA